MTPKPKPKKEYLVVLMYPDYIASNYGEDTFVFHTTDHHTSKAAIVAAQIRAHISNGRRSNSPLDFACVACISGSALKAEEIS